MHFTDRIQANALAPRSAMLALLAATGCSFAPSPELPQPVADLPETFLESEETGEYTRSEELV